MLKKIFIFTFLGILISSASAPHHNFVPACNAAEASKESGNGKDGKFKSKVKSAARSVKTTVKDMELDETAKDIGHAFRDGAKRIGGAVGIGKGAKKGKKGSGSSAGSAKGDADSSDNKSK